MIDARTAADVRAAEGPLLARERGFGGGLMERASFALATAVLGELAALRGDRGRGRGGVSGARVVGLIGPGSNGGDALHAMAFLARRGVEVLAVLTAGRAHAGGLAAVRAAGGRVVSVAGVGAPGSDPEVWIGDAVVEALGADVVLDGLLGIGSRGGLTGEAAQLVLLLAELRAQTAAGPGTSPPGTRGAPVVVAVDLPSGIGVDDGRVEGPVLAADLTVTFGCAKPGLLLPPAAHATGRLTVVDLGLGPVLEEQGSRPAVVRLGVREAAGMWPVPPETAHKYQRGVVGVVAGAAAYPGAAVLTVRGALGAGVGMVRYLGPPDVERAVLAAHPEAVAGVGRVQSWVLGPGIDPTDATKAVKITGALQQALADGHPAVVDAGALGLLHDRVGPQVVLTPHAGELARLLVERGVEVSREQVESEPVRWAREAQVRTGATVLLKGAVTVVVGPDEVLAQADAPRWLATAGAGDVLAGLLGAILAGRADDVRRDPGLAAHLAALAALVHGRAAHRACPGGPVTATDVADALPATIAELLGGDR
ncbi:bifunctional ADP-dependent NAD(P)H-hydrate dehydratase/NAD(P)H-hydrate epimerase [Actinotalea sp. K2]|uniref:bifunctional ADP-dependent NAD(P)H-hydrate dehydratase/NAD(P)H-hydrate epimerase n=1 Tax=Actinotalea sp. K2 TaxID=2939438 RepID=UPI0020180159|nr:bifunctional ADP-dependent NAD(P)H-hydrate dehydratase/NAD(P)H-hydrate epimerase [Actinotalea sp. K2]MCL3859984.1 bifunctional ADP-dependent (S)-NAD(P)H-hydrate dehydratase/NAD(P)H-hydrate epimerase [Actinotalea sp. K2]